MQNDHILIVGHAGDPSAALLLDEWRTNNPLLLTPKDLTSGGWRHEPLDPAGGSIVAHGRTVPVEQVHAVVNRLSTISPAELSHLSSTDRGYAATEAKAMLDSWLVSLRCPVINRPHSLEGNSLGQSHAQWVKLALRQGIRVEPGHVEVKLKQRPRSASRELLAHAPSVVVVGNRTHGDDVHASLEEAARALAAAGGADVLEVRFRSPKQGAPFLAASTNPPLTKAIGASLLELIGQKRERSTRGRKRGRS